MKRKKTTCSGGTNNWGNELAKKQKDFCKGSDHLDLSNTNVKNIIATFKFYGKRV